MQQKETDLAGLRAADAKAYIAQYLTTLKLTEKKLAECTAEEAKWRDRVALARSKGIEDLAQEAEKQMERVTEQKNSLSAEIAELKSQIEIMRKQLPGLAARERSVDPDLLEQELLMATGYSPGEEDLAATDRRLKELEQSATLDAELTALKAKYNCSTG
ncbi:MAG: chromosome partitioning protein [Treponema sp.]|nr:chromosome partitioning protein [Treponema sp.]